MARKEVLDKQSLQPVERLLKLGQKRDRSLVVEAILEYLETEEERRLMLKHRISQRCAIRALKAGIVVALLCAACAQIATCQEWVQ